MKQSVQEKVDAIMKMVNTPIPFNGKSSDRHRTDSLAQVIKTQEDADKFLANFDAAIALAKKKASKAG